MPKVRFTVAEGKRVQIANAQRQQIENLYKDAYNQISEKMRYKSRNLKSGNNARNVQYLNELADELKDNIKSIDAQTESLIKRNMELASKAVVANNGILLSQMGFSNTIASTAFSYVSKDVVEDLVTGNLYKGRWNLSKAIWGDNTAKLNDIDYIIARGVAEQKSTYDIAKDLEKYVNPSAKKDWEWSKVYPNSKKVVDYNAQRLARTMVSHAYQESFVRTTKDNPFIESYQWLISNSDRVCPLCVSRAEDDSYGLGAGIFPKNQLPLDHPNGMCVYVSVINKPYSQIAKELNNWSNGTGNAKLNKQIDKFVATMD